MHLVLGLGNPEAHYTSTRHNMGFLAIDEIAKTLNASWKNKPALYAEVAEIQAEGKKVILAKPQTFMNLSGKAAAALMHHFRLEPKNLIVITDDATLPIGRIRIRTEGSAGGHNGLKSIMTSIGTEAFMRIRIGVGIQPPHIPLENWVLQKLSPADEKHLSTILQKTTETVQEIIRGKMPSQTIHALENSPTA